MSAWQISRVGIPLSRSTIRYARARRSSSASPDKNAGSVGFGRLVRLVRHHQPYHGSPDAEHIGKRSHEKQGQHRHGEDAVAEPEIATVFTDFQLAPRF